MTVMRGFLNTKKMLLFSFSNINCACAHQRRISFELEFEVRTQSVLCKYNCQPVPSVPNMVCVAFFVVPLFVALSRSASTGP